MWLTGPAAPRHVESSQTRARTRVPRISRQILNHCATREAPSTVFIKPFLYLLNCLCTFVKYQLTIVVSISGLSILFHWYICLSFHQYHTVLITIILHLVLKLRSVNPPTLLFSFRIVLAILAPLFFDINFGTNLLGFDWNCVESTYQIWDI